MSAFRSIYRYVCLPLSALVLFLIAGVSSPAQQADSAAFAPDSAELYESFFRFHNDFSRWSDQKKMADAASAKALDDATAKHFAIDGGDVPKLTGISRSVQAEFDKIDRDLAKYLNERAKYEHFAEPAVIQQFADRRQKAAMDGVSQMQKTLKGASWTGLYDYINNIHRLRYRRVGK